MNEKIEEIKFDILPVNYLNPFKAKEHIKYLLSRINDTEQEREHLSKELIQERMKVVALQEMVNKHEIFKRAHEKVVSLEDEELYKTLGEE